MPQCRRQFLRHSRGLALAAGLASRSTTATAAAPVATNRRSLKKGYMLNTFPGPALPLLKQFELLKAAGFDGVEPRSHPNQGEVLRAHLLPAHVGEEGTRLRDEAWTRITAA